MALRAGSGADLGAVRYVAQAYRTASGLWRVGEGPPYHQTELIDYQQTIYTDIPFEIVGRNTDIDNARKDLWEGPTATYAFPTGPIQMKAVSTSADDAAAGTGMQQLHIHYLDENYVAREETVTLNGLTPVNTVATDILRVNWVHSWAVGSGGLPAGNVSLTNLAGTVTYGFVGAGINHGRQAIYTVPAGYTAHINHWQASSGSTGEHFCQTSLRATTHRGVLLPGVFLIQDETGTQNGGSAFNLEVPIHVPAMADIKISAISDSVSANVTALGSFRGWLERA